MASVTAWNDMMTQFLNELKETFPEEKAVKKYYVSFDLLRKSNPKKGVKLFMEKVGGCQQQIMAKDDKFILESDFLEGVDLSKYWTSELSENTKNAIWQYIQTLYILGTTITMIPQEALNMIENVAQKCVSDGSAAEGGVPDLGNLLSSLSGMIQPPEKN